jgi:hypothetical protein
MSVKPEPATYPETYYAGAYWGPRKEPPEECARRTAEFLRLLAECDPCLSHWYKLAKSLKDARKYPLMPPEVSTLTEMFQRGVSRENGGPVNERLGFSIWIGNGGDKYDSADLRISGGVYSEAVSNVCVLSLPTLGYGANAERVLTASVLTGAVRSMALAYEPDWAVAMSHAHRDMIDKASNVWLGWITYLSRRLGVVPPLPAPVRMERVEDKGTLIVLTPERFTAANPEHVALARRVHELLVKAGLIRPRTA